jgi:hypothetical protein
MLTKKLLGGEHLVTTLFTARIRPLDMIHPVTVKILLILKSTPTYIATVLSLNMLLSMTIQPRIERKRIPTDAAEEPMVPHSLRMVHALMLPLILQGTEAAVSAEATVEVPTVNLSNMRIQLLPCAEDIDAEATGKVSYHRRMS